MRVDLCLNPKRFTKAEALAKLPLIQKAVEKRSVRLCYLLRNILVHLYWDIDYRQIYRIVTTELENFDRYAQHIQAYVEKEHIWS